MFNHSIHPIALELGPLSIYWYGVMWATALLSIMLLLKRTSSFDNKKLDSLVTTLLIGTLLGAKLGYVLFYTPSSHWAQVLFQRQGFAFHGGLLGFCFSLYAWTRYYKESFWICADKVALCIPIGLFWGRLGNFLNSELYGYPTDLPWAVVFHLSDPLKLPRHPSQVYEALAEGLLLGLFLYYLHKKNLKAGQVGVGFLGGYGLARFCVEFFRVPDQQIGLLYHLSQGQWFCLLMVILSLALSAFLSRKSADF